MAILCKIGFHSWGDWHEVSGRPCKQIRCCTREHCTERESQIVHDWADWEYKAIDSCQQFRRCTSCTVQDSLYENPTFASRCSWRLA